MTSSRSSPNGIEKFNPFHDARGRFSNKHGFKTYSANPKLRAAQPSILRSAQAGHGRTLNVHRESKGESVQQNANWLKTGTKPRVPAAVSRARYQQRKLQQQQQQQQQSQAQTAAAPKPQQKPAASKKPAAQQQTQQQKPVDPNSAGAGKAKNAVDGKDLSGKFRFDDKSADYSIEQVIKAQGFDGKPTLISDPVEFSNACKASNFIAKRGIGATNQATLDAYDQALKTGDFYVKCSGGSAHGYGMYAASVAANGAQARSGVNDALRTAQSYAGSGSRAQKIYTMTLDKSAKIGNESTLRRQMQNDAEFQKVCNASSIRYRYTKDVGVYAAYKGYDAYIAGGGRSSSSGSRSDYTVILNRSKVIIYDDSNTPQF